MLAPNPQLLSLQSNRTNDPESGQIKTIDHSLHLIPMPAQTLPLHEPNYRPQLQAQMTNEDRSPTPQDIRLGKLA